MKMEEAKENFSFGEAIRLLKRGHKVSRRGWNGKGQFIYYVSPGNYKPCTDAARTIVNEDGNVPYRDYIAIYTVQGTVVPWVASQTDILAEDWYIVA